MTPADEISVKMFGAVGDGVADDTVAIQNALDTPFNLFFPPGTYNAGLLSRTVTKDFSMRGDAAVIRRIPNSTGPTGAIRKIFDLDIMNAGANVSVSGLTLDGNGVNQPAAPPEDLYFHQKSASLAITAHGVEAGNVIIQDCNFLNSTADGVLVTATDGGGVGAVRFENLYGERGNYLRADVTVTGNARRIDVMNCNLHSFEIETEAFDPAYPNALTVRDVTACRTFDVNVKGAVAQGVFPAASIERLRVGTERGDGAFIRRFMLANVDAAMTDFEITTDRRWYPRGKFTLTDGHLIAGEDWVDTGDNQREALIREAGTAGGTHKFYCTNVQFSATNGAIIQGLQRYYHSVSVAPVNDPAYVGTRFAGCSFEDGVLPYLALGGILDVI